MNHLLNKSILLGGLIFLLCLCCTEKIPKGPERIEVLRTELKIKDDRLFFAQENNWDNRYKLPPLKIPPEEFEYISQWRIPFIITIYNDFDEGLEGEKWVVIKVKIWPADSMENWHRELIYCDTVSLHPFAIPPGDSITYYTGNLLTWDQRDASGKSIHLTNTIIPLWIECRYFQTDSLVSKEKPLKYFLKSDCDTTYLAPEDTVLAFPGKKRIYAQAEVQIFKNYHVIKSKILEFYIYYYFPPYGFAPKFSCHEGYWLPEMNPCP